MGHITTYTYTASGEMCCGGPPSALCLVLFIMDCVWRDSKKKPGIWPVTRVFVTGRSERLVAKRWKAAGDDDPRGAEEKK
jgi:hypothetical protein